MAKDLSRRFRRDAEGFAIHSPLYAGLAANIADDPELLTLAGSAASAPPSNLLFAAVHSLLLGGVSHPLAEFYPSVSGSPPPKDDPFPHFRSLCLEHEREIREILTTRLVQTNEVRRCSCLLPAFGMVSRDSGKPLALVEVGASAGLNLAYDRYRYDFGDGRGFGDESSPVRLFCEVREGKPPPLPSSAPEVSTNIGLDLNPLDVTDQADARWLEALIWPEEFADRAPMLRRAIEVARKDPPNLTRGDALELLPKVLENIPENAVPCVFHTFTINQFTEEMSERLTRILAEHSRERPVYRVSIEWISTEHPLLRLAVYDGGDEKERVLAVCDDHGTWIEWLE